MQCIRSDYGILSFFVSKIIFAPKMAVHVKETHTQKKKAQPGQTIVQEYLCNLNLKRAKKLQKNHINCKGMRKKLLFIQSV